MGGCDIAVCAFLALAAAFPSAVWGESNGARAHNDRNRRQSAPTITITSSTSTSALNAMISSASSASTLASVSITQSSITNAQLTSILSAVTAVTGGITINGVGNQINTIVAPNLRTVQGAILIQNMGRVSAVGMTSLTSAGSLTLNNLGALATVQFGALTAVNGALLLQNCRNSLSGSAISAGFSSVATVTGTLTLRSVAGRSDSMVILPALRSLGGLYVYQIASRGVSFPVLTTLGSATYYNCGNMHILDFPSLTRATGSLSITALGQLSNLCGFPSLQRSGYTASSIRLGHSNANLNQMPPWMAGLTTLTATVACSAHPSVIIATSSDYTRYAQNSTLTAATSAGAVVITWSGMTPANLATLLGSKTAVDELVIDGVASLTSLSALASLTTVTTRLVLEQLPVTTVILPRLTSVGGALWVSQLSSCTSVAFPQLQSIGGDLQLMNVNRVTSAVFTALTSIGGRLNARSVSALSGTAFSNAFSSLVSVVGEITLWHISRSGSARSTPVVLSSLQSIGGLFVREIMSTTMDFPVLVNSTGRLYWYNCGTMRALNFPALRLCQGQIVFVAMSGLPSLCGFDSLQPAGYQSTRNILFGHSNTNLLQMPTWMAVNGSRSGTSECSPHDDMIIASQADYQAAAANRQLVGATRLASVVITWSGMTDTQLGTLLQNKVAIDELVMDGASAITTVRPALTNLVNVSTRIVFNSMSSLRSVDLPALTQVGAGIGIERCGNVVNVTAPNVAFVGVDLRLVSLGRLSLVSFPRLTLVNGSLYFFGDFALSGAAISTGFPTLTAVRGHLHMRQLTRRSQAPRSPVGFSRLVSTGALTISEVGSLTTTFPRLNTINGRFFFYGCSLVNVSFPSLRSLTGQFQATAMPSLTSLCGLQSLQQAGYTSTRAVSFGHSTSAITEMPAWMAASSRRGGTTGCVSTAPTQPPTTQPPTGAPTFQPTSTPTQSPSTAPTALPTTAAPTARPTAAPVFQTAAPSTSSPVTLMPTRAPTWAPTRAPIEAPTFVPIEARTRSPMCPRGVGRGAGGCLSAAPTAADGTAGSGSSGSSGSSGGSSGSGDIIPVVIIAVVTVGVVIAAVVYLRRKNSSADSDSNSAPHSFANPLYEETTPADAATAVNGDGAYMDMAGVADDGYQVFQDAGDDSGVTGYMDVSPTDDVDNM